MSFSVGDKVQSRSDPSKIGIIEAIGPIHAGLQYYRIFWGGVAGTMNVPEVDLKPYQPAETPSENLIRGNLAGYQEFQRLITYQRLLRDFPLRNNIYAFNASRTRFYPYQFKPLIKFLDSPSHRLLICDEVGLGKTIEAGLILTELQARQTVRRVLVVCPANLTQKWKLELERRFGEEFRILQVADFKEYLDKYEEEMDRAKIKAIISLESIRTNGILERLETLSPHFDLVIVDEAHHMRNFGRKQRKAGVLLSSSSTAMIMLTATPVHLGNENLFSLLNILDEDDFPDLWTADLRFRQNEPIVKAQVCLGQIPPKLSQAAEYLKETEQMQWIKDNPLAIDILERLQSISPTDKRRLIELQRDLAELNLLGHIFTRTRKREVHANTAQRRAYALEVTLSQQEREFYDAVTAFVKAESEMRGHNPLIQQWLLNMPQRRMASSIPAMVKYYREHLGFSYHDRPEDFTEASVGVEDESLDSDFASARERLESIVRRWPIDSPDSKYEKFKSILEQLKKEGTPLKIMVFAFFKGTLNYLARRLKADGFNPLIITGDIKPRKSGRQKDEDDRTAIIEKFESDPKYEILLSSRVGSEGLDFQFCNTMFNYDLPWNPMEVEQRIGRLDRIGQEAPVIRIYNFWIKDTIEERILRRLYERIHIFERSIGELEMILGDVVQQLEKEIFSKHLTPEEEIEQTERAILILENKINDLERLESEAAHFVGTDKYFEDEVEAIKKRRRYITGEQLRRFITDFIRNHAPRTRLEYDVDKQIGRLLPDENLRSFIAAHHKSAELARFISSSSRHEGIEITFDSDVAFHNPKIEFINVLHPLVIAIVEQYNANIDKRANAQHVLLRTDTIRQGFYYYFIFRLRVHAAKSRNTLECIILDENFKEACDLETAEILFGEMVEKGEDPHGPPLDLSHHDAEKACSQARDIFLKNVANIRAEIEKSNDRFVDRRLASLNTSYEKNIKKQRDLLSRAEEEGRQERYIRMLKGTIKRLEGELRDKRNELERLRNVEVEWDEIAAGILEVV